MNNKNEFNYVLVFLVFFIFLFCFFIRTNKDEAICIKYKPDYLDELNLIKEEYNLLSEKYSYIPAEVLNLSVGRSKKIFAINKGKIDNIKNNSFVVNSDGLVGVVINVYKRFSIVRSISSSDTILPVEVNNCYGTITIKDNKIIISDLINCSHVEKGDSVFTSKYNYSSSNILIGNIESIKDEYLTVKSVINPYKIRYVGVINDS